MLRPYPWTSVPRVSRHDASLLSRLQRHLGPGAPAGLVRWTRECLALPDTDPQISAMVVPVAGVARELALMARGQGFTLQNEQGLQAMLVLQDVLGARLLQALLRAPDGMQSLSSAQSAGLTGFALTWLLHEAGLPTDWCLSGPAVIPTGPDPTLAIVRCRVQLGQRHDLAWLLLARADSFQLSQPSGISPSRLSRLGSSMLHLPLVGARTPIRLKELLTAESGDLLVIPGEPSSGSSDEGPRRAELTLGYGTLPVVVEGPTAVRILGPYRRRTEAMNEGRSEIERARTLIEQLDVELIVELGRVQLLASELLELSAGDVITLATPLGSAVDVRAGGKLFARGELVDVDGETGVRLTEVFD